MSTGIRTKRGAKINLKGGAEKILYNAVPSETYALKPDNFFGIVPRLMVKEGENIAAGAPVFHAKHNPEILFVSPVSGTIKEIRRGAKRKILEIVVNAQNGDTVTHDIRPINTLKREDVLETLLKSGAWAFFKQRPYGVVADPEADFKSVYISAYASGPLDVDFDFLLKNNKQSFQKGIAILNQLLPGKVNLGVDANFKGFFENVEGVNLLSISGAHPAGNVSFQIQKNDPINMGEKVLEIRPEDVINIGLLFSTGQYHAHRTIAVAGGSVGKPQYITAKIGAEITSLTEGCDIDDAIQNRFINGNVLSGATVASNGYLNFYNNLLTVIPEGNDYRLFGWLPFVDNKIPSLSKTSFSWLFKNKGYEVNTNLNGEERALVVTGEMEKVFPMDIYPMQLLKACMAGDIDKMEALGIYEVVPEDFGLIDYASTSKIEAQEIIREGIELMIKEVG